MLNRAGDGDNQHLFQQHSGEKRAFLAADDLMHLLQYENHGDNAADGLAQERRPRHAGHAHVEVTDEEDIHKNIRNRGHGEEVERRFGIPQGGENARRDLIEHQENITHEVNLDVRHGVLHRLHRRVQQCQHPFGRQHSDSAQQHAENAAEDERGRHAGMHLLHFLLPEQVRCHDGCADVAAKRDGDENQRDFGAVADKRLGADEMPRNEAVRDVVELLEDDAAEQGQRVSQQHPAGLADGQILHEECLLSVRNPSLILRLTSHDVKYIIAMAFIFWRND